MYSRRIKKNILDNISFNKFYLELFIDHLHKIVRLWQPYIAAPSRSANPHVLWKRLPGDTYHNTHFAWLIQYAMSWTNLLEHLVQQQLQTCIYLSLYSLRPTYIYEFVALIFCINQGGHIFYMVAITNKTNNERRSTLLSQIASNDLRWSAHDRWDSSHSFLHLFIMPHAIYVLYLRITYQAPTHTHNHILCICLWLPSPLHTLIQKEPEYKPYGWFWFWL